MRDDVSKYVDMFYAMNPEDQARVLKRIVSVSITRPNVRQELIEQVDSIKAQLEFEEIVKDTIIVQYLDDNQEYPFNECQDTYKGEAGEEYDALLANTGEMVVSDYLGKTVKVYNTFDWVNVTHNGLMIHSNKARRSK